MFGVTFLEGVKKSENANLQWPSVFVLVFTMVVAAINHAHQSGPFTSTPFPRGYRIRQSVNGWIFLATLAGRVVGYNNSWRSFLLQGLMQCENSLHCILKTGMFLLVC